MRVMLQVRHWVLRMLGISRHWYYECSIWGLATGCRRLCTKKQPEFEGLVFALPLRRAGVRIALPYSACGTVQPSAQPPQAF